MEKELDTLNPDRLYIEYLEHYDSEFHPPFEVYKSQYDPILQAKLAISNEALTSEALHKLADWSKQHAKDMRAENERSLPTIPNGAEKVRCLCCEKELDYDEHELVMDAGFVEISFHYGSRHDQCKGFYYDMPQEPELHHKLLACDKIEGYMCDDCFVVKAGVLKGFMRHQPRVHFLRKV